MNCERSIALIGEENFNKIKRTKVALFGLGGVGGTCFEALVRSGVEYFYIQDFDTVSSSNINRQILFNNNDIGKIKVDSAEIYAKSINENVVIKKKNLKLSAEQNLEFLQDFDYVIDCIDDVAAKIHLIKECKKMNLKVIISLGMGKKLDPSKVRIIPLNKTTMDPLAKKIRYLLRKENLKINDIYCAFSDEQPLNNNVQISSMIFVPSSAGLNLAHYVINDIISKEDK